MRVTVLVPNLASNGIARAWILARLLERHYDVQTLGALLPHEEVCPWFADYPWGEVPVPSFAAGARAVETAITGDVVVAYRASALSFGVGLRHKLRTGIPLVLDMPEWQVYEHLRRPGALRRWRMIMRHLIGPGWSDPRSFKYKYILDHLTGWADARLVASTFLAERYGGVLLPQGVDPACFDPSRFDRAAVRREWGLSESAKLLLFAGNPQPGKGVGHILAALRALAGTIDARLVLVGRDRAHPHTRRLLDLGGDRVIALGPQPAERMPELLAAADLVALPQTDDPKSRGYVPCKIYEAMAMEVPVVASSSSDIPAILDGCGYVVPIGDEAALRTRIEHVLTHPDEARDLGRRARVRVLERYSWDVMDGILREVIDSVSRRAHG